MKIEYLKSPNYEQVKRRNIKYIIIHYTGMKTAQESIKRLRSKKHKVSSHYFVNERGKLYRYKRQLSKSGLFAKGNAAFLTF